MIRFSDVHVRVVRLNSIVAVCEDFLFDKKVYSNPKTQSKLIALMDCVRRDSKEIYNYFDKLDLAGGISGKFDITDSEDDGVEIDDDMLDELEPNNFSDDFDDENEGKL